uniref:Uncharacterized protein LOC103435873 n=1 Tax=Rhizophora mucronata TaxID=61149 RepID=A0A2P2JAD2_RHIMU
MSTGKVLRRLRYALPRHFVKEPEVTNKRYRTYFRVLCSLKLA